MTCPVSCIGTDTSIKSGGAKLVLWAQTYTYGEKMNFWKCFPHVIVVYFSQFYNGWGIYGV